MIYCNTFPWFFQEVFEKNSGIGLNNLTFLPPFASEPKPENNTTDTPIQTHRQCNSDNAQIQSYSKKYGKHKPHSNGCKQGNRRRKLHIPSRSQSLSKGICEGKCNGVE